MPAGKSGLVNSPKISRPTGSSCHETHPFDRFLIGDAELEVTQIGKECHGDNCAIFREVGNCVMPKEGIFCRVLRPGKVKAGDQVTFIPRIYKLMVITLSDRASRGIYEDKSGPRVVALMEDFFSKTQLAKSDKAPYYS